MYFVVLPDGQKFGPADVNLLNQWVAEGRVLANTMLEDAQSGQRLPASSLPGLQVATAQPPGPYPAPGTMNPPQQYGGYYRGGPAAVGDSGQNDLTLAYVFASLGLVMCLGGGLCGGCGLVGIVFPILGLVYAKKAEDKGNPGANGARIMSWVALALQIVGLVFSFAIMGASMMGRF
ncbi:MAG: hypothetical protein H7Y17_06690 [Chlorobia bacterium]|nr:hypothetical protein [Fimbriimonadaceae bacterium]